MAQIKRFAVATAVLFLVISASVVNLSHLYYMAALLLALPATSYVIGFLALRGLSFAREAPGVAWEGESVALTLHVTCSAHTPRLFLRAEDALPRWLRLVSEEPPIFHAVARGTTHVQYEVDLLKRGLFKLEAVTVVAQDPLGLFFFSKRFPCESEILVYPRPQRIPDILRSGAERFGFRELPIAAARGSGVDPDGVREYVPGDPLRRMHWKSFARTGRLSVIEFEESRAVNVVLALDRHVGSNVGEDAETTFEYLIRAAASLAQLGIRQGASVRLVVGDEPDPADVPGRGSEHLLAVLGSLARAEATDDSYLGDQLIARIGRLAPGTSIVVLTSTIDEVLPGALLHYAAAGAQVTVIYAEPSSFTSGWGARSQEAQRRFLLELSASRAAIYLVRKTEDREVQLEPLDDVRILARSVADDL